MQVKVKARIPFMYGGTFYLVGEELEIPALDVEPLTANGYIESSKPPKKKVAKNTKKTTKETEG